MPSRNRFRSNSRDRQDSLHRKKRRERRQRSRSSQGRKRRREDSRSQSRSSSLGIVEKELQQRRIRQKIKQAVRENRLMDNQIAPLWMTMNQSQFKRLTDQAHAPSRILQPILVRELFIGGVKQTNPKKLRAVMETYGPIENIDVCNNFVFVKYHKVMNASNACSNYQNVNLNLHSCPNSKFKMFFSDFQKRYNVVGDSRQAEEKDTMIPVLFVSFRGDSSLDKSELKRIFGKYGSVRDIVLHKQDNPSSKVVCLVQFEQLEDALLARDKLLKHKEKLKDRNCQISVLLDTKKVPSYQLKRQHYRNKTQLQPVQPPPMLIPPMPPMMGMMSEMPMPMVSAGGLQILSMINESKPIKEQPKVWRGIVAKNSLQVNAVGKILKGGRLTLPPQLNITMRAQIATYHQKQMLSPAVLELQAEEGEQRKFEQIVNYLLSKNRAGVAKVQGGEVWLLAKSVNNLQLIFKKSD